MEKIEGAAELYSNGVEIPFDLPACRTAINPVACYSEYIKQVGAIFPIVATVWIFNGKKLRNDARPIPIPDMSGLVYATDKWKTWVVLNPDGSTRGIIEVPRISEKSRPDLGDLGNPRHFKGMAPHIMHGEGSDGDREDCRFFFDMHTCKLLSVDLVGKHW